MSEAYIERRVEKMVNDLDREFQDGKITEEEYNVRYDAINRWSNEAYMRESWAA